MRAISRVVESGEGIESFKPLHDVSDPPVLWNPVKELKEPA